MTLVGIGQYAVNSLLSFNFSRGRMSSPTSHPWANPRRSHCIFFWDLAPPKWSLIVIVDRTSLSDLVKLFVKLRLAPSNFLHLHQLQVFFFELGEIIMAAFEVCWSVKTTVCIVFLGLSFVLRAKFTLAFAKEELEWRPATATWYGSPDGDGSDGGACGYGSLVDMKPYRKRVGAVSPVLFKGGEGCGACYKVKCMDERLCAKRAVTVIVTDECPGGYCAFGRTHFDLSGSAFGRMAVAGESSTLLNAGELPVLYRRTLCKYPGKNMTFHVNEGSTDYWFSILIEYENGDGEVGGVQLKEAGSQTWMEMKHLWGATWCLLGGPIKAPFSLRVKSLSSNKTLSARDVIPKDWYPNATYKSRLNFDD